MGGREGVSELASPIPRLEPEWEHGSLRHEGMVVAIYQSSDEFQAGSGVVKVTFKHWVNSFFPGLHDIGHEQEGGREEGREGGIERGKEGSRDERSTGLLAQVYSIIEDGLGKVVLQLL